MIFWARRISVSDVGIRVPPHPREIQWDEIVGIKESGDGWLMRMSRWFPCARLYLRNGSAVRIPSTLKLTRTDGGRSETLPANWGPNYRTLMEIIRTGAKNVDTAKSNWLEWRIAVGGFVVYAPAWVWMWCQGLRTEPRFEAMFGVGFGGFAVAFLVGWLWERHARAKYMSRGTESQGQ